MERTKAEEISRLLAGHGGSDATYSLERRIEKGELRGFHQWADNRPCEGAYLFRDEQNQALWILLIDWREQDNFYVVLFPESRSGPVAEIHTLDFDGGDPVLRWRYSPSKRDGLNAERRAYFIEAFLSDHVQISVPLTPDEVDDFLGELFALAKSREKADVLDPDRPSPRSGFPEGKVKQRLHFSRERNQELVRQAKAAALAKNGCLKCACCGFDFFQVYGEVGRGFIEAHHTKPVSSLHADGEETRVEDLALVCSNCHRMLHRRRPWLEMDELTDLLAANPSLQARRP